MRYRNLITIKKNKKKRTKLSTLKKFMFCLFLMLFFLQLARPAVYALAAGDDDDELIKELNQNVSNQLNGIDFSAFEDLISGLNDDELKLFGSDSFLSKVKQVVSGEYTDNTSSFFSGAISLVFSNLISFLPILSAVIAFAIFCGLFSNIKSKAMGKATGDIIFIACFGAVVLIMLTSAYQLIDLTKNTVLTMRKQMNLIFPILLTIMTALGGAVSAKVYQPAVALLSNGLSELMSLVILPLYIICTVLSVIGNLSSNIRLDKLGSFIKTVSNYIIGFSFTIFIAFLTIQGITAASYDGVSVRTAKFAVNKYVPVLGGYLSDGFSLIAAGSVLVKNAIGLTGLLLLFTVIISPVIKIAVFSLCLKLASGIIEPIGESRMANFISEIGKNLSMLLVIIIGVAFMFFVTVILLICSSNAIF